MKLNSKRLALTGILLSFSLIIGTIENYLPPIIPGLPFVKIGFSNVVITFALLTCGLVPTLIIGVFKSVLVPLFVGNPMMIAFSLTATVICILISCFCYYNYGRHATWSTVKRKTNVYHKIC